jgi:8-oxo-dGTP pyrophosphatase MutT (NUDIX family)
MTPVVTRVRALLVTPSGNLLALRRVRADLPVYWVMPGGGVEDRDASLDAAVVREVTEETGAAPAVHRLIHIADAGTHGLHAVFLARIAGWSESAWTGPEFSDPANGAYALDELPMSPATFTDRTLRPLATSAFIARELAAGTDLFDLPDLRADSEIRWAPRGW